MEIEKKIKTITKEVYEVDGIEFESYSNAKEYVVENFYNNELEKHHDDLFNWELFKCNTKEEFEMVQKYYDINFYIFCVRFDYKKENYPIRCIYTPSGEVYSVGEKLYEGLIEFNKEK